MFGYTVMCYHIYQKSNRNYTYTSSFHIKLNLYACLNFAVWLPLTYSCTNIVAKYTLLYYIVLWFTGSVWDLHAEDPGSIPAAGVKLFFKFFFTNNFILLHSFKCDEKYVKCLVCFQHLVWWNFSDCMFNSFYI